MKNLLLAALTLSLATSALAASKPTRAEREAQRKACAFGESTGDLSDMLDAASGTPGKIWYKGEHVSLHKETRLGGLSSTERRMIQMVAADFGTSEEEILKDFSRADGYITYFSHNSLDREFAIVASYPGDNEFGQIIEIKKLKRNGDYKILRTAAVISDGDLEDCQVTKKEVEEKEER